MPTATDTKTARSTSRFTIVWAVLRSPLYWAIVGPLCFWLSSEILYIFALGNFRTVIEGQCYRSGQIYGSNWEETIGEYNIRTVINLRGENPGHDWYEVEQECLDELKISRVDITYSAFHPPEEPLLAQLVEALAEAETPVLMHCATGADRTGFAAACFLLLHTDTDLDEAREQLAIQYGHNPFGLARCQSLMLDEYELWLDQENEHHSAPNLRHWAAQIYNRNALIRKYDLPSFIYGPSEDHDPNRTASSQK